MRRRLAVPLIAALAFVPWWALKPEAPPGDQSAMLDTVVDIPREGDWLGGLSGIEVTADGARVHVVSDRGHRATGELLRTGGVLSGVRFEKVEALRDKDGVARDFPHTDAEGMALDAAGRVYVSFEHVHRVLYYDDWGSAAQWPSYTRIWRSLAKNEALEALAVDTEGALYAIPEAILSGASENVVFRRRPNEKWTIPFTLPVDAEFNPVGADFGPDGRLYVLERGVYPFGFYSRVRAMRVTESGVEEIETVLRTPLGLHGNLEGLAVWRDDAGTIRLTMVSDDNFYFFLPQQIVEYRLTGGLAPAARKE